MFRTQLYSYIVSLLMLCVWLMPSTTTAQHPTDSTLAYSPAFANLIRDEYPSLVQGDYLNIDSCRKITSLTLQFDKYPSWKSDTFTTDALNYFSSLDILRIRGYRETMGVLPTLPSRLKSLSILNGRLEHLPLLPVTLEMLNCSSNKLTALPAELPAGLKELDCSMNQLTTLPDKLPVGLEILYCSKNKLTALPAMLPVTLEILDCSSNKFTALCVELPTGLGVLDCSSNKLTALPAMLPTRLVELYCWGNKLTALPAALPAGLKVLSCSKNPITQLPALPNTLQELYLTDTQVKCLPIHSQYLTVIPSNLPLCK